jgi:N6-adenosine-specific RNA methylase IME4
MQSKPFAYSTMTIEEIKALSVAELADKKASWCFLWTTNRYLRDGFDVLDAWGFKYRQTIVWYKTGGPSPFGPALAPNHAEFLLVGARGAPEVLKRWAGSVVPHIRSRRHSEKPALFADLIQESVPGPYVELFARAPRLGWDSWGKGYEVAPITAQSDGSPGVGDEAVAGSPTLPPELHNDGQDRAGRAPASGSEPVRLPEPRPAHIDGGGS